MREIRRPAFEKQFHITHRFLISLGRGESRNAGPQAASDVVLQARPGMKVPKIDLARWNQKMAVDQVHDAIGKAGRKIRAVVAAAVFAQTPGHINSGEPLAQGQLHVGISLVVAQQNVKSWLPLLDEVVLERERLFVVGYDDVVNVDGL